MSIDVPLDEFLVEARKLNPGLNITLYNMYMIIEVTFNKEKIGWLRININDKGRAIVINMCLMDDASPFRNLEQIGTIMGIQVSRTNKATQEALEYID